MRISDWSSDVCSSDLKARNNRAIQAMKELKRDAILMKEHVLRGDISGFADVLGRSWESKKRMADRISNSHIEKVYGVARSAGAYSGKVSGRSEEHTSELQSLMRISYAVFCLKK